MDDKEFSYICRRCNKVFTSVYGMKDAFCPKCGQHSKTPYYSVFPKGDRDFSKEWPSDFHFKPPKVWPDGTENSLYCEGDEEK